MKKFSNLVKENKAIKSDILIIVDVQKEFEKFIPEGFVEKLFEHCLNFKEVYQIWDINKTDEVSYTFPNQIASYKKRYGISFSDKLKNIGNEILKKFPNIKEGEILKFKDSKSVVVRVKNNHKWFYVNEDLVDFFKKLKGKEVELVGGAENECLQDVFEALESFGVKPYYNYKFIYSAKNSNKEFFN